MSVLINISISDPMRITKKFAGASCIGKQVYQPCRYTPQNIEAIQHAREELAHLERVFLSRLGGGRNGGTAGAQESSIDDGTGGQTLANSKKRSRLMGTSNEPGITKRPMSAPDLSILSDQMTDSELWGSNSDTNTKSDNFSTSINSNSMSADNAAGSLGRGMSQRSQSAFNLDSYSAADQDAGDLLLEFFRQMHQQQQQQQREQQQREQQQSSASQAPSMDNVIAAEVTTASSGAESPQLATQRVSWRVPSTDHYDTSGGTVDREGQVAAAMSSWTPFAPSPSESGQGSVIESKTSMGTEEETHVLKVAASTANYRK